MKIVTDYYAKPIPTRKFDWNAVDYDTYDGEGPVGYGATEAEAIADLEEQLELDPDLLREDRDERRQMEREYSNVREDTNA